MNTKRFISFSTILLTTVSSVFSQCIIAGTDFDTDTELCCPILKSNSNEGGWYNEELNNDSLCKTSSIANLESAKQIGIGGFLSTNSSLDLTDVDKIFTSNSVNPNANGIQYGKSAIVAQPKLASLFLKANDSQNNIFVNVGCKDRFPMLSYKIIGLEPGSDVTLTFTVHDLFDITYFCYLNDTVCAGANSKKKMSDFITGYNYVVSNKTIGGGNGLEFGVTSSADVNAGDVLFDPYNNNMLKRDVLTNEKTSKVAHGGSANMTYTTKVPETGSLTFYFYKTSDCFKIPVGIDNIKVTGKINPTISAKGNPCPEQPILLTSKQKYPEGTKFSWEEAITGQKSSNANFNFIPDAAETDYTVTFEVTLPGCNPAKSDSLKIHSGTCCTSNDGAPMAMTNLFFDDFGNFISDDLYEWTDKYGVTHTEQIPAGHTHNAQSIYLMAKIPCVRAYNIESAGAKLNVPYLKDEGLINEIYNHGMYVISAHGAYPGGVTKDADGYAKEIPDNISTGGMLQFDLLEDGTQDEFFEVDIEHICTGKEITFGAAVASMSEHPGCIEVSLEHNGKVLEKESESFNGGSDGWKNIYKSFILESEDVDGVSEATITMKLKHNQDCVPVSTSVGGRDYAIDNIFFAVCTPPNIELIYSVNTGKNLLDLNTNDVLTLNAVTSDAMSKFYTYYNGQLDPSKKIGYVYQYTFQDPSTETDVNRIKWHTIHKEEVVETKSFDVEFEKYWDEISSNMTDNANLIYFRVVAGEYSDLIADQSWKKHSALSPCRKVSISNIPIVASLNCPACVAPDEVVITMKGNGKYDSIKSILYLCPGDSAQFEVGEIIGTDADNKSYYNYVASWHKDDINSTPLMKKACSDADHGAHTFTISYDDVIADGKDEAKYIILIHDNSDPSLSSTPCDHADTIRVVAALKPEKTLYDPDSFCEGTLSQEPDKRISGYDISWYEDKNVTKMISEPEIASVMAADSPKSYYYVLTDEKTGCQSEINEYKVEVASVPPVPTIEEVIVYQKSEGENGGFKMPTYQNPAAIKIDNDCVINWYRRDNAGQMIQITEADATPVYNSSMVHDEGYTYYIKQVIMTTGCESLFVPVNIIVEATPTSLKNTPAKAISIAPNPASTKISVIANEAVEKVEILNMVGEVVKVSNSKDIDTSNLSNGVYFVRTTINDETTVHKLVINK